MNTDETPVPKLPIEPPPIAPRAMAATRPFHWSVRREIWENRSIYIAPLIVSGVVLFGYLISTIGMPHRRRALLLLDPAKQRAIVEQPYDVAAMAIMLTAFLVAIFYCLDALHGERRDRSILFWKSLPVSDLTTVLSKAIIPLLVLPLLTFVIVIITQLGILLISTAVLLPAGLGATTWERLPFLQMSGILLYGLIASALWHVPFYAWLLLVSGYARRAPFLWAVLPWLAIAAIEKIAFDTAHFAHMLSHRVFGNFEDAFVVAQQAHGAVVSVVDRITQLDPLKFLCMPGLWIGLVIGIAFFAAAVRVRRYHGPL